MAWVMLLFSAVLEPVWATALANIDGLSRPVPLFVFAFAISVGTLLLARAAKTIPMSTAYGVWTGIGAVLTVAWSMTAGHEEVTAPRVFFLALIVLSVVGLKVVPARPATRSEEQRAGEGRRGSNRPG